KTLDGATSSLCPVRGGLGRLRFGRRLWQLPPQAGASTRAGFSRRAKERCAFPGERYRKGESLRRLRTAGGDRTRRDGHRLSGSAGQPGPDRRRENVVGRAPGGKGL